MAKASDRAKDFVNDVKAGMSDLALQKKYDLPNEKFFFYKATALDYLAKQKATNSKTKRRINAHQVLADIKSGEDDEALMAKYELSSRQLQSVFRQMIQAGLATAMELSGRLSITKSQVRDAFVEMGKAIQELD